MTGKEENKINKETQKFNAMQQRILPLNNNLSKYILTIYFLNQ